MQPLVSAVQRVGPYLLVALVMPGGVFLALGAYLYRRLGARGAKRGEQVREIRGWVPLPREGRASARMVEAEPARMEHDARGVDARAGVVADVDRLAEKRMPELREVDADLVLPARLEPALDERRAA